MGDVTNNATLRDNDNSGNDERHLKKESITEPLPILHSSTTPAVESKFCLGFDNTKAGLETVDKAKTQAIIEEISKGSSFYTNEQRKSEMRKKHILQLQRKSSEFKQCICGEKNLSRWRHWETKVHQVEEELEAGRHFGNYVHVDMDMFYAAVEMKKNPSLASVPLGVGSAAMLSTTNYAARRHGVRSGMPGFVGRRLCPALVVVPPDFPAYRAEAAAVRRLAAAYDPHFTSVGLDELTMEVSAHLQGAGSRSPLTAADIAAEFRARVFAETQLTASAGIAPTATLAKIASNYNKPNGQHDLQLRTREEVIAFMKDLPVRKVPGIGRSTECILQGLGINTLGDVYERRVELCYILTEKLFRFLLAASLGVSGWMDSGNSESDDRTTEAERKSVGQERTFTNLQSGSELQQIAHSNLQDSHKTLLEEEIVCRQVVLKIKRTSFQVQQFSKNLPQYTDDIHILYRAVDELLLPIMNQYGMIRLLGVRLTDIITKKEYEAQQKQHRGSIQLSLTDYCKRDESGKLLLLTRSKHARDEESEEAPSYISGGSISSNNSTDVEICDFSDKKNDNCVLVNDNNDNDDDDDDVVCLTPLASVELCEESDDEDDVILIT
ncbi:putative DNA polymerase kappa, putative,DNA polymerase IV [Trypanosoma theileri]|uniref:DNA polymerase kappa n=1 Tax=Trypanosoma theileri TaxID=67003 RepID=A0A1X0NYM2_9TRYP|nr:putative DNA polymerase kappa, putative,DNA polymerase IV [Trypanosoma theileri]ORC89806.1 putative DNA polymerase kappa, putative,DNA polymerase IV [Trypanosoma theileri]